MSNDDTLNVAMTVGEGREHLRRLLDSLAEGDTVSTAIRTAIKGNEDQTELDLGLPWTVTARSVVITSPSIEWHPNNSDHPGAHARALRMGAANDWVEAAISGLDIVGEIEDAFASSTVPAPLQAKIDIFQTLIAAAQAKE